MPSTTIPNPNFTLPEPYYTSPEIFQEELQKIFYSKWIYVACEPDIPNL
jgi:glycine betaine catabolism A